MKQAPLNMSREDKFIFVLNIPEVLKTISDKTTINNNRINSDSLEFSITGTVTPQIEVESVTVPYGASSIKVSSHRREPVNNITFDFIVDNEYKNYWVIYKWLDILNDVKKGIYNADNLVSDTQPLTRYSSTFSVYGLDEYNNRKIRFDYIGSFPTKLDQIVWKYNNNDESIMKSSFTFSFSRMEAELI